MIPWQDHERIKTLLRRDPDGKAASQAARKIQLKMNPHPSGQLEMNIPVEDKLILRGMQHKYDETVLFFPTQGQTCHAYCTYCFRWAQFAGIEDLKFASSNIDHLIRYLNMHPEVTDLLITGGDPLVMRTKLLNKYIEPLLTQRPGNLSTIRIGTKALAYWPYRFLTDRDSDDLIRLFEKIVAAGFHFSIMSHFSHPRELETDAVRAAIGRLLSSGAAIRCQAPLVRHVNDDPEVWADMWRTQVKLGMVPYYMFVERDTGPKAYFKTPLVEAYRIFTEAYNQVSGLCRTVRGPSMSATPGKVLIEGITEINGEKLILLKFLQGRDPDWVNRIFLARYDENASWLDELKPAFGAPRFFFERRLEEIKAEKSKYKDVVSF
jgi:L-lysine 2,3-aminomutase